MNVVIIGDSHVEAMGPELTRQLPSVGINVLGYTARRGWSTDRYNAAGDLGRLVTRPENGAGGRPDAVIVSLGGNGRPSSKASYQGILTRAVEAIRAAGVSRIVWVGPATSIASTSAAAADAHRRHEQNADWQRDILPALGVAWIDARPMTRTGHAGDGVHFTIRAGYPAWASALKHEVAHALARVPPSGGGGAAPPATGGKPSGSPAPSSSFVPSKGGAKLWVPIAILGTTAVGVLFLLWYMQRREAPALPVAA